MQVELSAEDLDRIVAALDSHIYWQLADQRYRSSGYVLEPGADDPAQAEEIEACTALADRLQAVRT